MMMANLDGITGNLRTAVPAQACGENRQIGMRIADALSNLLTGRW